MWNESEKNEFAGRPKRSVSNPGRSKKHSWLLYVRLKLRDGRHGLKLRLPLALFVPPQLLLAYDGLLALVPGEPGCWARQAADTLHAVLLQLMQEKPQTLVEADLSDHQQSVRVLVRTCGFCGGEKA